MIRVFLVDDQALVRAGTRLVVDSQPDMEVVGEAGDGREALEALGVTSADVVLMDVRMPRLDGVGAVELPPRARRRRRAARRRPHDLRPRRVRLRGAPRGRERVPAQGRRARGAPRRDPRGRERRRGHRAERDAGACSSRSRTGCRARRRTRASTSSRTRERAVLLEVTRGASERRGRRCPLHGRGDGEDPRRAPARQARRCATASSSSSSPTRAGSCDLGRSRERPRADAAGPAAEQARDMSTTTASVPRWAHVAAHLVPLTTLPSEPLAHPARLRLHDGHGRRAATSPT